MKWTLNEKTVEINGGIHVEKCQWYSEWDVELDLTGIQATVNFPAKVIGLKVNSYRDPFGVAVQTAIAIALRQQSFRCPPAGRGRTQQDLVCVPRGANVSERLLETADRMAVSVIFLCLLGKTRCERLQNYMNVT